MRGGKPLARFRPSSSGRCWFRFLAMITHMTVFHRLESSDAFRPASAYAGKPAIHDGLTSRVESIEEMKGNTHPNSLNGNAAIELKELLGMGTSKPNLQTGVNEASHAITAMECLSREESEFFLSTFTAKELKELVRKLHEANPPPRGLRSTLKRKQNLINYLAGSDCHYLSVDELVREYLASKDATKVGFLEEEIIDVLQAINKALSGYDCYGHLVHPWSKQEVLQFQRDIERMTVALEERDCSTGTPATEDPSLTLTTKSIMDDENLRELHVALAPRYETSNNTFAVRKKLEDSYLLAVDLKDRRNLEFTQ